MQVHRWRLRVGDVEVRKARRSLALGELRDSQRREDGLVKPDALGESPRVKIKVVYDRP